MALVEWTIKKLENIRQAEVIEEDTNVLPSENNLIA